MSDYTEDHAGAVADVAEAGAAITFTLTTPGTLDPATETYSSPTTVTIAGYATENEDDSEEFRALSLVHASVKSLFFTPSTLGQFPLVGYTTTWGGQSYTVKQTKPYGPNGSVIFGTVWVVA